MSRTKRLFSKDPRDTPGVVIVGILHLKDDIPVHTLLSVLSLLAMESHLAHNTRGSMLTSKLKSSLEKVSLKISVTSV